VDTSGRYLPVGLIDVSIPVLIALRPLPRADDLDLVSEFLEPGSIAEGAFLGARSMGRREEAGDK
jgi:hypothetical protein